MIFGAIAGQLRRIPEPDDESERSLRDDLGLEKVNALVGDQIAPQLNTRFEHIGYLILLTAAAEFAWLKVERRFGREEDLEFEYSQILKLRRYYYFWLDCFEVCLAMVLKEKMPAGRGFIGATRLKIVDQRQFEKWMRSLDPEKTRCWDTPLPFEHLGTGGNFLTNRLSYAFDRHKSMMVMLGLITDSAGMQSLRGRGMFRASEPLVTLPRCPLTNSLVSRERGPETPSALYHLLRKHVRSLLDPAAPTPTARRRLWDEVIFSPQNNFGPGVIERCGQLSRLAEKGRGRIASLVDKEVDRPVFLAAVRALHGGRNAEKAVLEDYLNLMRALNYFLDCPRLLLEHLKSRGANGASLSVVDIDGWLSRHGYGRRKADWSRNEERLRRAMTAMFANESGDADDLRDFIGAFYRGGTDGALAELSRRIEFLKGIETPLGLRRREVRLSQAYLKRFKNREMDSDDGDDTLSVANFDARLGVLLKIRRQIIDRT